MGGSKIFFSWDVMHSCDEQTKSVGVEQEQTLLPGAWEELKSHPRSNPLCMNSNDSKTKIHISNIFKLRKWAE